MNIHTIAAKSAASPARQSRSPKSVRPRFKDANDSLSFASSSVVLPPAVVDRWSQDSFSSRDYDALRVARAAEDGHPLASLMRMRKEAADQIERLLAFLDATDGDPDLEIDESDYEDGGDYEESEASGIADVDGLIEQAGYPAFNTKVRETLGDAIQAGS